MLLLIELMSNLFLLLAIGTILAFNKKVGCDPMIHLKVITQMLPNILYLFYFNVWKRQDFFCRYLIWFKTGSLCDSMLKPNFWWQCKVLKKRQRLFKNFLFFIIGIGLLVTDDSLFDSFLSKSKITIFSSKKQSVFRSWCEHTIRFWCSRNNQIINQDTNHRFIPAEHKLQFIKSFIRCIDSSNNTLTGCFLIASSSIDLPSQEKVWQLFCFQGMLQDSLWVNKVVSNHISWLNNLDVFETFDGSNKFNLSVSR